MKRTPRKRNCCETRQGETHSPACHYDGGVKPNLGMLRGVLVPWARGKCPGCGSTLCSDPLPHRCGLIYRHTEDAVLL